ncbi:MAG: hypothetical protein GEU86_18360 [Actinophytocola sp.]|nr:hypothetical protein [Actinophytocola sp.]
MNTQHSNARSRRGREWLLWLPGLAVALGAGAATAHGLFEVAAAAGVPAGLAWLYPLITDGLALVAYVSTNRLRDGDRTYAWSVVVLAAGLSGLAQAAYLAGGVGDVSTALRFGVGAWPAVAAAIVAHLLFLLGQATTLADDTGTARTAAEPALSGAAEPPALDAPGAAVDGGPTGPVSRPVQAPVSTVAPPPGVQVSTSVGVQPGGASRREPSSPAGEHGGSGARERARAAARRHAAHHGDLPSVRELQRLAEVSRGSAHAALKELREHPSHLHIVNDDQEVAQQ